jgi:hypothetical protein
VRPETVAVRSSDSPCPFPPSCNRPPKAPPTRPVIPRLQMRRVVAAARRRAFALEYCASWPRPTPPRDLSWESDGSSPWQHAPSRFTKVARTAGLHHRHPRFDRFIAPHPLLSWFMQKHPKATAFVFPVAHHTPILGRYVPIAQHISPVFERRASPRPRPRPRL